MLTHSLFAVSKDADPTVAEDTNYFPERFYSDEKQLGQTYKQFLTQK